MRRSNNINISLRFLNNTPVHTSVMASVSVLAIAFTLVIAVTPAKVHTENEVCNENRDQPNANLDHSFFSFLLGTKPRHSVGGKGSSGDTKDGLSYMGFLTGKKSPSRGVSQIRHVESRKINGAQSDNDDGVSTGNKKRNDNQMSYEAFVTGKRGSGGSGSHVKRPAAENPSYDDFVTWRRSGGGQPHPSYTDFITGKRAARWDSASGHPQNEMPLLDFITGKRNENPAYTAFITGKRTVGNGAKRDASSYLDFIAGKRDAGGEDTRPVGECSSPSTSKRDDPSFHEFVMGKRQRAASGADDQNSARSLGGNRQVASDVSIVTSRRRRRRSADRAKRDSYTDFVLGGVGYVDYAMGNRDHMAAIPPRWPTNIIDDHSATNWAKINDALRDFYPKRFDVSDAFLYARRRRTA